jgi:ribonuclease HI
VAKRLPAGDVTQAPSVHCQPLPVKRHSPSSLLPFYSAFQAAGLWWYCLGYCGYKHSSLCALPRLMPEWIHTLTVDASYNVSTEVTGVGIVVQQRTGRKGRGPILEEVAEGHTNVAQGFGELSAIRRALEVAQQRGFTHINVRSDYNAMRRSLREQFRAGSGDVGLRGYVLQLAHLFEWVDFGLVPRRKNQLAHMLARTGRLCVTHEWAEPVR